MIPTACNSILTVKTFILMIKNQKIKQRRRIVKHMDSTHAIMDSLVYIS